MRIIVGVSDMKVSNDLETVLVTYSLGSCIGVAVYDAVAKVGGLLHYLLPESKPAPQKAIKNPYMFADTGIPALFKAAYDRCQETENESYLETAIVYMADTLCLMMGIGGGSDGPAYRFHQDVVKHLGITERDFQEIMAGFGEKLQEVEALI